jgi:hypothetical protein
VQLWKVETSQLRTIAIIARYLAFSADGQHLAVGRYTDRGAALEIYDPETGALKRRLFELTNKERGSAAGFSPNGALFAATVDSHINLWDTASWQKHSIDFKELHDPPIKLTFEPTDPGTLVALTNSRALFWDTKRRKEKFSIEGPEMGGAAVALTSDGKILASGTFVGDIYLWDVGQRKVIRHVGKHEGAIHSLVFISEHQILLSASYHDATVKVWNMFTERLFTTRRVCQNGVPLNAFALSPDSQTLLTGGGDGLIKVWDVASLLDRKPRP